jgi:hypothetical protein
MTFTYRFASPVLLLAAAFMSGCGGLGSGANIGSGAAGTPATGAAGTPATGAAGTPAAGTGGSSPAGAAGSSAAGAGGSSATGAGGSSPAGAGGSSPLAGINAGAGPWGTPVAGGPTASGTMVTGTVTVNRGTTTGTVGAGFLGFSFEKTHLTNSTLNGANAPLIALFKLIGPPVIRIGANDVELCSWLPGQPPAGGGPPYGKQIGTAMVDGLNDFLNATGARVIYGLNFSLNNVANDVAEATYAETKLASNLYGFEIGNEINKYGTWASQRQQYESLATGVVTALPAARLIGPAATEKGADVLSVPWAKDESAKFPNKIVLLTQHYYLGGAGSTTATVAALQTVKSDIPSVAATMSTAATGNHVPDGYRFGEANSFYGHGQMGVSDTLVAGLWSIDLMFVIAGHGASGINFHGGETGMDGTRPFYYQPIVENNGVVQAAQPVFHGMLFFYLAGQGHVLETAVTSSNPNLTAYALDYQADGSTSVVLNNKNATTGVQVTVDAGTAVTSASAIYLQGAPGSLTAPASSVTLAGAHVTPQGTWARNAPFIQSTAGNTVSVFVPPASAALVRVK